MKPVSLMERVERKAVLGFGCPHPWKTCQKSGLSQTETICFFENRCGIIIILLTFCDTCMLFSCMFMMASEIFTSMGSMTDSKLKGPSSLSARLSMASEDQNRDVKLKIKQQQQQVRAQPNVTKSCH